VAISPDIGDREYGKFREATDCPGTVAVAVVNCDGSKIFSGTITATTTEYSGFPISGSASGVVIGATATIATYTVTATPTWLVGFNGFGDRYAEFQLLVNSSVQYKKILNTPNPTPSLMLAVPEKMNTGDVVELRVLNIGYGTGSYAGTILFANRT
jgi:hypothetical protein